MKKIGLITYHNPCNYGATLQTWATVKYFENRGFKVCVIDYIPSSKRNFGNLSNTIKSIDGNIIKKIIVGIIKNISYRRMKKDFDKYSKEILPLTKRYLNYEELKRIPPEVDYFCTGSDQVWNNYYTKAFEKAFFLDFISGNEVCFSFSSSFGKDKFDDMEKDELKKYLKKYEFITVRESDGINTLKEIGYNNGYQILDPTLMLEKSNWNDFATNNRLKDYVLVYQLHGDSKTFEEAKKFAKEKNLKLIKIDTMYHHFKLGAKNVMLPNMKDFLGFIKNASYVFTDSFHGVAFSLIFKRKMGITLPSHFGNRITSLLDQIDGNGLKEVIYE